MTLIEELKQLYTTLLKDKMANWHRSLPFAELIVDRRDKAVQLGFGRGTTIYDNAYVYGDVKVGENTWIGPFTILDGSGGLEIGSNCSVSAGVQIYTHDSVNWAISGGKAAYERAPVKIGDNCYIGPNTIIAKGVTIGAGTIIGACSLVLEDIPENVKAWGTPCRVRGETDKSLRSDQL